MRTVEVVSSVTLPLQVGFSAGDTLMLQGMMRSDELGFYDSLGNLLRRHAPRFSKNPLTDQALVILSHLRGRYFEAKEIEATNGKGSLLNLEDLTVVGLIGRNQILTPAEVLAAKQFRARHELFYRNWRALALTISSASPKGPAT